LNFLAPKIRGLWDLQRSPKKQSGDILDNGSNDFDYISAIYGDCTGDICKAVWEHAAVSEMRSANFVTNSFADINKTVILSRGNRPKQIHAEIS
jgi:hypothetical protein